MLHNSGVEDHVENCTHNKRTHIGSRNTPLELIWNLSSSRQATRNSNFKSKQINTVVSILSDKDPCGWPMRRFLFLFLLSISGIFKRVPKSLPRLNILHKNIKESETESKSLSLKRHSETRWSSRKQCVDAVLSCLSELHRSLVEITEGKVPSLKPHQFAEAHALVQHRIF